MTTTCTDCLIHRETCDGCGAQHSPAGDSEFHFVHTMTDHEATIAGTTSTGHWYCTCGRKVRATGGRDGDNVPLVVHTSGVKRIDGYDRRASDAPRPSQYRDVAGFAAVVR